MGKIKKILLVAAFALFTVLAACVGVSAQETAEENTDENVGMIYIKEITDDGNYINYGSLHEAIDVANASELDNLTIVVKGEVPYDRIDDEKQNCTHDYQDKYSNKNIYINKNITIETEDNVDGKIFYPFVSNYNINLVSGKTIVLGSDSDVAGQLVIDGGAIWDDNDNTTTDYANYDKFESSYNKGIVQNNSFIYISYKPYSDSSAPKGGSLIINQNVTIQNFVSDDHSAIETDSWVPTSENSNNDIIEKINITVNGTMINNASRVGGAIKLCGGKLTVNNGAVFRGNSAGFGGAISTEGEEERSSSTLDAIITINGGLFENNTAYSGGAISLYCSNLDADAFNEEEYGVPVHTLNMNGGIIRNNTAHTWFENNDEYVYSCGGGGISLLTRYSTFNMYDGLISGNFTYRYEDDQILLNHVGHAISATGFMLGKQKINLHGGKIEGNGLGDSNYTENTISFRSDLLLYKILFIFALDTELDFDKMDWEMVFPESLVQSRVFQFIKNFSTESNFATKDYVEFLSNTSIKEFYDLYATVAQLLPDNDNIQNANETFKELRKAGYGKELSMLYVSSEFDLGSDQGINVGVDSYVTFESAMDNSNVPKINVYPGAPIGTKVIEYENGSFILDEDFEITNQDMSVNEYGTAYYTSNPGKTYSATFTLVNSNGFTIDGLTGVTLPDADYMIEKHNWDIDENLKDEFCWFYYEYSEEKKCYPGENIFLTKDTTFYGTYDLSGNAHLIIDCNGGNLDGETVISNIDGEPIEWPVATYIDGQIGYLYGELTPPEGEGRIIPAGITTTPVDGIADVVPDCAVYNSLDLVSGSYIVNPYYVLGDVTLYVLWAYDNNYNNIPDFLEVTIKINPNNGAFLEMEEQMLDKEGNFTLTVGEGTEFGIMHFASLKLNVSHNSGNSDIKVLGFTDNEEVIGRIYNADTLPDDIDIYGWNKETYTAVKSSKSSPDASLEDDRSINEPDVILYAVYYLDNSDGSDTLTITVDANGGLFNYAPDDEGSTWVPALDILASNPLKLKYEDLQAFISNCFKATENNVILVGLTLDENVKSKIYGAGDTLDEDKLINSELTLTGNTTIYAVWGYDKYSDGNAPHDIKGNGIPDYKENLIVLTVDANGGLYNPYVANPEYAGNWSDSLEFIYKQGSVIDKTTIDNGLLAQFKYENKENVIVAGITTDSNAEDKIYSSGDTNIVELITGDLTLNESMTVYIVWAYDNNGNGIPDYLEDISDDDDDNTAKTIELVFVPNKTYDKDALPNSIWDIKLVANQESVINRLNSADFTFVITNDNIGTDVAYEIIATNDEIVINPVNNSDNRFEFHYDGKTGTVTDTATEILLGTVKFDGYGSFEFKVDTTATENSDEAHATTKHDNKVDSFSVSAGTLIVNNLEENKDDDEYYGTINTEIFVPTQKLTVKVDFPNAVENQDVDYQQMTLTVYGGDLKTPLVINLGKESVISDYSSKTYVNKNGVSVTVSGLYEVVIEGLLAKDTFYTVSIEGAGYRSARYTVTMTEDKTINFWNNVKDNKFNVEEGKSESGKFTTFLAGDIVKDNEINIYDLSAVVSYFGSITLDDNVKNTKYAKYDLNRDGKIDSKDVAYVLVSWGK